MAMTYRDGQRVWVQVGKGPDGTDQRSLGTVTRVDDDRSVWVRLDEGDDTERSWPSDRLEPAAET
jgi:hypothetical protein